ncbi:DUF362 domain-containing protein [Candidatus Hydrogenedentota bacterium]
MNASDKNKFRRELSLEEIEEDINRNARSGLSRRDFIRNVSTGAVGAGLAVAGAGSAVHAAEKSRIILARDAKVMSVANTPDAKAVEAMFTESMKRLTGQDSLGKAMGGIFKKDDVVGLKVNCLGKGTCSTRPELVSAITKGLQEAGVLPQNIIIWERKTKELTKAGFVEARDGGRVQVYGTDGDFDDKTVDKSGLGLKFSKILTTKITALINVPMLKTHPLTGVTVSLKNHLGSIDNPNKFHQAGTFTEIAGLNASPVIKGKTRLIVCDALRPLYNAGPGDSPAFRWNYGGLIVSRDPVAVDAFGKTILVAKRKEAKGEEWPITASGVSHIADSAKMGLGVDSLDKMDVIRIEA